MLRGAPPPDQLTLARLGGLHAALCDDPRSASAQLAGGDGYTVADHLLFLVVDELRVANWQRTKDGAKGRNRPKAISPLAKKPGVRTGKTDLPPDQVIEILKRFGPAPTTA